MNKVGIAVALVDYKYIHATGTGGFTVKIEKGKEYDLIEREGKVSVRVAERNGKDVFAPSFHRDRYKFIMHTEFLGKERCNKLYLSFFQ